jgi:molybdopterin-guanine dinucleotide biosynthesis protein A
MGRDKASLPFGPDETIVQRIARVLGEVVPSHNIVCVAAPGQSLPPLPAGVMTVFDNLPHQGPLAGFAIGLAVLDHCADEVFATGCDTPLISPAFVERMFNLLADYMIAAPHDSERWHPLAAVYHTSNLRAAETLLAAGERPLVALLDANHARRVTLDELRDVDPALHALKSCNTPADYASVLAIASVAT